MELEHVAALIEAMRDGDLDAALGFTQRRVINGQSYWRTLSTGSLISQGDLGTIEVSDPADLSRIVGEVPSDEC